jgi:hypothetical protein
VGLQVQSVSLTPFKRSPAPCRSQSKTKPCCHPHCYTVYSVSACCWFTVCGGTLFSSNLCLKEHVSGSRCCFPSLHMHTSIITTCHFDHYELRVVVVVQIQSIGSYVVSAPTGVAEAALLPSPGPLLLLTGGSRSCASGTHGAAA